MTDVVVVHSGTMLCMAVCKVLRIGYMLQPASHKHCFDDVGKP